jgi:hypothetical protein
MWKTGTRLQPCFAVTDLDAEVRRLTSQGVALRTEVLDFHARKLVFLSAPEGITVELRVAPLIPFYHRSAMHDGAEPLLTTPRTALRSMTRSSPQRVVLRK